MITGEYIKQATRMESLRPLEVLPSRTVRLLHAAMGLVTESGELVDALKKHLFYGKPLDETNLQEEAGDLCWYLAVLFDAMGVDPEVIMQQNLNKLWARYPEKKFDAEKALNRDLEAERKVLEA